MPRRNTGNRGGRNILKRKRKPFPIIWPIAGVATFVIGGVLYYSPSLRAKATSLAGAQVQREFGTMLGVIPPTTGRALLCELLDNSGSSEMNLMDMRGNKVPYRGRLADESVRLSQKLIDTPSSLVDTYVWRLGAREGFIHEGVNDELRLKRVLNEQYVKHSADKDQGSNFAPAFNAVLKRYHEYKIKHKDAVLVITIATDGGVTDLKETRAAAEKLAKENVIVFVHGIIPDDRLWERSRYALEPLITPGKLIVSNLTDFDIQEPKFVHALEKSKAIKKKGAPPLAATVLPASGPISSGGAVLAPARSTHAPR